MLRRVATVTTGLAIGIAAAVVALTVGIAATLVSRASSLAFGTGLFTTLTEFALATDPARAAAAVFTALWSMVAVLCCAPLAVVALTGEAARLRGPLWCSGATAVVTALMPAATMAPSAMLRGAAAQSPAETAVLLWTGACAGISYWLIAGGSTRSSVASAKNAPRAPNGPWQSL